MVAVNDFNRLMACFLGNVIPCHQPYLLIINIDIKARIIKSEVRVEIFNDT